MTAAATKVCTICKQDCSAKPRVKDAQGRYACKACMEKLKKKAAATAAPIPVVRDEEPGFDLFADLGSTASSVEAPAPVNACASCGQIMAPQAVVCMNCGYNAATRSKQRTRITKESSGGGAAAVGRTLAAPLLLLVGGSIGGVIGAAIWAAIVGFTGYEIGWVAVGVGALTGWGVAVAAQGSVGAFQGIIAAVLAVAAIALGKFGGAGIVLAKYMDENRLTMEQEIAVTQSYIADDVVMDWEGQGQVLNWPDGMNAEIAASDYTYWPDGYPPEVVTVVEQRWDGMTPDQQENEVRFRRAAENAAGMGFVFASMFSPWDFLWFIFSVATAYKVGSGGGE